MEFSRFVVLAAEKQDHQEPNTSQLIFVDTVVLDKSHAHQPPILHCLRGGCDLLDKDAFEFLGPVAYVCRQSRRVYLLNRFIVCYNRLITFSASKVDSSHSPDIMSPNAIRAIIHTLRCYDVTHSTLAEIASAGHIQEGAKFAPGPTTILHGSHVPFPESWRAHSSESLAIPIENSRANSHFFRIRG